MCHLEPKQFVGSMAFNRFIQASPSPTPARRASSPSSAADAASTTTASASAADGGDSADRAASSAEGERAASNEEADGDELEYIDDSYVPGGGGAFGEAREVARGLLRQDSFVGEVAKSLAAESGVVRREGAALERSLTTVTATSDVSFVGVFCVRTEVRYGGFMMMYVWCCQSTPSMM